ncbi:MAG: T9SS type A sorting domain-containing protein [Candidatus Eisenbacteria bacterium]|nr:T9SS type A sorting domain-containing protein [Candidatus Eisenbacteria bacterium]
MRVMGILGALLLASAGAVYGLSPYVEVGELGAGKDGAYLEVRVGARGWEGVQAVHVDVEYDRTGLEPAGFTAGDLFVEPLVLGPFDRSERGVSDVQLASLRGPVTVGDAAVGVFRFRVLDEGRASVRVVSFETAGEDWSVETHVSYANALGTGVLPRATRLLGNVPNPFNPTTEVRFELASRVGVSVEVYDVSGRVVRRLVEGVRDAGSHAVMWDGRSERGEAVSSGVYFVRFRAGSHAETQRVTLIR